jgi:hypothetical protein
MPPLAKQLLDLPFSGGLAEWVHANVVQQGSWLRLVNVEVDKAGCFQKRSGYGLLPTTIVADHYAGGDPLPAPVKLMTLGNSLHAIGVNTIGQPFLHSWSPAQDEWVSHHAMPPCTIRRTPGVRSFTSTLNPHIAYARGMLFYFWRVDGFASGETFGGIQHAISDEAAGTVLRSPRLLSGEQGPHVAFACGDTPICIVRGDDLLCYSFLNDLTVQEDMLVEGSTEIFDAAPSGVDSFVVAYVLSATPTVLHVSVFDTATFSVLRTTTYGLGTIGGLSVHVGPVIYVAAIKTTNDVVVIGFDFNTLTPWATSSVIDSSVEPFRIAAGGGVGGSCTVLYSATDAVNDDIYGTWASGVDSTGTVALAPAVFYSTILRSRPFFRSDANSAYALLSYGNDNEIIALTWVTPYAQPTDLPRLMGTCTTLEGWLHPIDDSLEPFRPAAHAAYLGEERWALAQTVLARLVNASDDALSLYAREPNSTEVAPGVFHVGPTPATLSTHSRVGTDLFTFDFEAIQAGLWQTAEAQGLLAVSGGLSGTFDGRRVVEAGFLRAPKISLDVHGWPVDPDVTDQPFGLEISDAGPGDPDPQPGLIGNYPFEVIEGGIVTTPAGPASNYAYAVVYEWYDSAGNLHQSTPGYTTVKVPNHDTDDDDGDGIPDAPTDRDDFTTRSPIRGWWVHLRVTYTALTRCWSEDDFDENNVQIAIYRTKRNDSRNYYRLTPPNVTRDTDLPNRPNEFDVAYVDSLSDEAMVALGYGFLYTAGGVLPNLAVPASVASVTHRNRLWLASAEDTRAVWYSKELVPGEAPGFHAGFVVRIDDSPDGITTLGSLGDDLIIFTRSRIYYVTGAGPNDQGRGELPQGPFPVTRAVGCIDGRSLVTYPGGLLFQGTRGIYALSAAHEVTYVGGPVEATLEQYGSLRGAVHDPAAQRVYWLAYSDEATDLTAAPDVAGAGEGDGDVHGGGVSPPPAPGTLFVVYDYGHGAWYVWQIAGSTVQTSHVLWQGAHTYADASGVAVQGFGTEPALDPGEEYPISVIETPWLHLSAVAGQQRCWRAAMLADRLGEHTLSLHTFIDNSDTAAEVHEWDVGALSELAGLPVMRVVAHLANQVSSVMKFRISDGPAADLPTGERGGFAVSGMSLELGVEPGLHKVPAGNRR